MLETCRGMKYNLLLNKFGASSWLNTEIKKASNPFTGPRGSRKLRFPDFVTTAQDGGKLSALCPGRLYPQEIFLVLISVRG